MTSAAIAMEPQLVPATVVEWFVSLVFGWLLFLLRVLPRMTFDPGSTVVGMAALILLTAGAHAVGRSASKRFCLTHHWRLKWTVASVGLLFLLFVAGTSLIGITHQIAWLATSDEPLSRRVYADYLPAYIPQGSASSTTRNMMKQVGLALHNYADTYKSPPAGGTFDAQGRGMHSWESSILVFSGYQNPIDFSRPWRDPKNEHHFRSVLHYFINPSFRDAEVRSGDGFGLSHYASNVRVLGSNLAVGFDEIADGTANTVMLGEVNTGFRAWGDPVNWRDPAAGLGNSPETFGGATDIGVNFVMADGSVRFVSQGMESKLLRAMATPSGQD
ncbi:MAG: DUF1559 domain-containing protein [Planctomycetota bacterium]|nr:DUF1559 domain-containing protein [Planctomycetaceae bacterium]MDQ3333398.1 DUF1559 domain-containing protein [Planctomycetota bacterium]